MNVFVLSTVLLNCNQKTADVNLTSELATVTGLLWLSLVIPGKRWARTLVM